MNTFSFVRAEESEEYAIHHKCKSWVGVRECDRTAVQVIRCADSGPKDIDITSTLTLIRRESIFDEMSKKATVRHIIDIIAIHSKLF